MSIRLLNTSICYCGFEFSACSWHKKFGILIKKKKKKFGIKTVNSQKNVKTLVACKTLKNYNRE